MLTIRIRLGRWIYELDAGQLPEQEPEELVEREPMGFIAELAEEDSA